MRRRAYDMKWTQSCGRPIVVVTRASVDGADAEYDKRYGVIMVRECPRFVLVEEMVYARFLHTFFQN